jgi:predicted RNase H-like HicB family nuclease
MRHYENYAAVIHKDDDSSYGAYFPDLPGCFAAGDTEDEALHNVRISLRMYADDLAEDGKTMPRPRTVRDIVADTEVKESISDGYGFIVLVPLLYAGKKRRVNVSLDPALIAAVDEAAKIAGTNRSDFLANVAWREVEASTGAVKVAAKKKRSARDRRQRVAA